MLFFDFLLLIVISVFLVFCFWEPAELLLCLRLFITLFRIWIHWFQIRIRIQLYRLNTDPDPGFWWPTTEISLQLKIFLNKIAIYLSLGPHKGLPSYRRSLQPSKENIQDYKTWNLNFFLFSTDPMTCLNPDPIRIRNTAFISFAILGRPQSCRGSRRSICRRRCTNRCQDISGWGETIR